MSATDTPRLPAREASAALSEWLSGPRGKLLRRAQIGLRRSVLEVGCGHGHVTSELARRCPGRITAIDLDPANALSQRGISGLLAGDASRLPFANGAFDLIFCQNVLLWVSDLAEAIAECVRVLAPGGALVAIEPDYGGMMEYPDDIALRDVWIAALRRAGADPFVGRRLPVLCEAAGLHVEVELQNLPRPASEEGAELLRGLELTREERRRVRAVRETLAGGIGRWQRFCHLPYVMVVGQVRALAGQMAEAGGGELPGAS